MLNKKRANLRDVARRAGVSVATVSRVLNTPRVVANDTRTKVEAAIEALNFRPSAAARAINSGRTYMVGALVPTLDNSIFSRFLASLETRLDTYGLSLIVAHTGDDPDVEAIKARKMIDIGAEGLIVSGITHSDAFLALANQTQIPLVAISYYEPNNALPTVGYDNAEAARLALEHLQSLGHERIAVLHGPTQNNDRTRLRIKTVVEMTPGLSDHLYPSDISIAQGRAHTARIVSGQSDYTAILCFSDVLATGALFELQDRGLTVPTDMSVIGIENLPSSAYSQPPLTTVRLEVSEMGSEAANSIGRWVEHGERPRHVYLQSSLMRRQTTAPPRIGALNRPKDPGAGH